MFKKMISPSLLSAEFVDLKNEVKLIADAGADFLHIDVMDGYFVPNLTIGMPVIKSIKQCTHLPLDVHLMIHKPERYIEQFIDAGANYLTLHIESTDEIEVSLNRMRQRKVKPGLTLKPATAIERLQPYLHLVDLVLVMSVEPGFGGQSFLSEQLEKVKWLKKYRDDYKLNFLIEIDGGVNAKTAPLCWDAGVDIIVAGSAVFCGEKSLSNYKKNIEALIN